jgi:LuxR family maltose regulon positive regulatory protein
MRVWDAPVTVISAPAGFGKTTLVAYWATHAELLATWVTLDARDNDPVVFWSHVAAALGQYAPGLEELISTILTNIPDAQPAVIAAMTIAGLTHTTRDLVLVLDDYDLLRPDNAAIHEGVTFLVEHMPYSVHLVLAGRSDPPLPLAAWRTSQPLLELSPVDLALSREEAVRYMRDIMSLSLRDEELDALYATTEGWLIGLRLAALAIREQPNATVAVIDSLGESATVIAYVVDQVVGRLPAPTRDFLFHVILLDRLSPDLCDAVTQSRENLEALVALQRAHLFLRREEGASGWYRFHGAFAAAVRHHVRTTMSELVWSVYHLASIWCETHGYLHDAVEYALTGGDAERAAQLLDGVVEPALEQGTVTVITHQLERLPDALVQQWPRLCVAHAHVYFSHGDRAGTLRRVQDAEAALAAGMHVPVPESLTVLQAEIRTLRSAVQFATAARAPRAIISTLQQVTALLPSHHAFHNLAAAYMGVAQLAIGSVRAARQTFASIVRSSETRGDAFYLSVASLFLGLGNVFSGRLNEALNVARRGRGLLGAAADTTWAIGTHLVTGCVFYERNQLERARLELVKGSAVSWDPVKLLFEGRTHLALVQFAQGDRHGALRTIDNAYADWARAEVSQRIVWSWTGALIKAYEAYLWLLIGDVTSASDWARALESGAGDTVVEKPVRKPRYVVEAEQLVVARLHVAEGHPQAALEVLEPLRNATAKDGWVARLIEVYTLQALAYAALHDDQSALNALRPAIELAAGERFIRVFLDGGAPIQRLLVLLMDSDNEPAEWRERQDVDTLRGFIAALLLEFAGSPGTGSGSRWTSVAGAAAQRATESDETLAIAREVTPREFQVLGLLVQGDRDKDIAHALGISASTVKHHLQSLFRKLDVQSRTQAIARATALRLLDQASQLENSVRRAQDDSDQKKGTVGPPYGGGSSTGPNVSHALGGQFST